MKIKKTYDKPSYMVVDDNGHDLCDEDGNNAWDTFEEADRVMGIYMNTLKLPYNKTIATVKGLSISVACILDDIDDVKKKDVQHLQDLITKLENIIYLK